MLKQLACPESCFRDSNKNSVRFGPCSTQKSQVSKFHEDNGEPLAIPEGSGDEAKAAWFGSSNW